MNTFEAGKVYRYVSLGYWFYDIGERRFFFDQNQLFLVLKTNLVEDKYYIFILTGNNKEKKGCTWLLDFPKEGFSTRFEVLKEE